MKIDQPITLNLVKLYKGIVDFYYWNGIAVARRWPRDPHQPGTPLQRATWNNLTGMFAALKIAPQYYHRAWVDQPLPPARSATDIKRKTLMRCLSAGLVPKFVKVTGIWHNPEASPTETMVRIYISPEPGKNMADVQWKYRVYDDKKPPILWVDWGRTMGRTHGVTIDVKPDIEYWSFPTSQIYNTAFNRYEIMVPSSSQSFAYAYVVT